ncbi:MAG TPA: alpha/beta fold hydrolase [Polyangiaceae bacterium]|jgi:predicted esterase|nr:alpha/beta fold hydrolase [Polyangiaceae bacterium]
MSHTLLAFHGFTMNGELMRDALGPLVAALAPKVRVVCLNAPHACSAATVERMYRGSSKPAPPPHLSWWNASDDGLDYRGWEDTRDLVREALDRYAPVSILGFSQGAILAAAVAALAQSGELPEVHGAVLVAGRTPRAARLQAAFMDPIALPSLHVWGERDTVTGQYCQELADHFAPVERELAVWSGGHVIPTKGPAYEAMVRFVLEHA